MDPVEALIPAELRPRGHRKVAEVLDGKEWTGLVPFRVPGERHAHGLAEVYVMPSETEHGERGAVCIAVDVRALRRIETDLAASQAIFGQSPFGFVLFGTDLTVQRANQRFATVFGGTADAHRGRCAHDYLPRQEADRMTAALRQVLETGEAVTDLQLVGTVPGDTERRHWSVNLYRVHSGSGRPIGVAGLGIDVTRRHNAAREAASARRNLALLGEASARIGTSLDLETTARELLDVAVPGFCDLASVDLYQALLTGDEAPPAGPRTARRADGEPAARRLRQRGVRRALVTGATGATGATGRAAASTAAIGCCEDGGTPPRTSAPSTATRSASPCAKSLRTGRPPSSPAGTAASSTPPSPCRWSPTTPSSGSSSSPGRGRRALRERDRALAVELAARAAVCIDNARLYRREHERALILQRSLLAARCPRGRGLDIACRYLPGNAATEVGGDWFDVIELPGHRTALVVGDVMGRGLRAAVAMGELRTAARTLAQLDLEPAEVLSHLDEIARASAPPAASRPARRRRGPATGARPKGPELSEVYLATCVYAVCDAVTAGAPSPAPDTCRPSSSSPARRRCCSTCRRGCRSASAASPSRSVEVELPEGALLALYTDGLVESRTIRSTRA